MNDTEIVSITGRRRWDSRGRPTLEAEVRTAGGATGRALAPAGASTGRGEALDLRDGGPHLGGFDVGAALANINGVIAAALAGTDAADQPAVDAALEDLDPSGSFARLGGNATVAVSMAAAAAAARRPAPPVVGAPRPGSQGRADAADPDIWRRGPRRPAHRHPGPHGGPRRRQQL